MAQFFVASSFINIFREHFRVSIRKEEKLFNCFLRGFFKVTNAFIINQIEICIEQLQLYSDNALASLRRSKGKQYVVGFLTMLVEHQLAA